MDSKKRARYLNEIRKNEFRVTIFGSARMKKGSIVYRQIHGLGKMLAEMGIDIVTGGGPGIMAAASNGHKEGRKNKNNGSHAIGLEIKLPKEQKTNDGVDILRKFKRFSNRLDNFMLLSNVIVVAPGGVGTLLELFYSWQLVQVNQICHIPIILIGKHYKGLLKWLAKYPMKKKYFDKKDLDLIFLAKDVNHAAKIIDKAHKEYKKGTKNICLNLNKYKLVRNFKY